MDNIKQIIGRQAVEELLDAHISVEKVFLARNVRGPFEKLLRRTCRERRIPLSYVEPAKLNKLSKANHQGVIAFASPLHYTSLEDLIPHLYEQPSNPIIVALDGVTDVGNVGAIARSCVQFGVGGLLLPTEGSAMLNDHAIKASAGGLFKIQIARTTSLVKSVDYAIESGYTVLGMDGGGDLSLPAYNSQGQPTLLIMGDEARGLHREIARRCHHIVSIPMSGSLDSLNVSVACGITLYALTQA